MNQQEKHYWWVMSIQSVVFLVFGVLDISNFLTYALLAFVSEFIALEMYLIQKWKDRKAQKAFNTLGV